MQYMPTIQYITQAQVSVQSKYTKRGKKGSGRGLVSAFWARWALVLSLLPREHVKTLNVTTL
jgi:hypothetical protein